MRSLQNQKGQACVHPLLDIWDQSIVGFFDSVPPLKCSHRKNWVFTKNGRFKISREAIKNNGDITCDITPVVRGGDDFTVNNAKTIRNIKDGTRLTSDFFRASCEAENGQRYDNLHMAISRKENAISTAGNGHLSKSNMGMNVLMLGFDSVSRLTWMRNLPNSHSYFVNVLKGIVLEGYNIVGDGTPQALLPMLTGKTELELPEAGRGKPGATTIDGHPWIWKEFKRSGYITQFGEDETTYGAFQYRMLGFRDQPVDHYIRPYYLQLEKLGLPNLRLCMGSIPVFVNVFNWMRELFSVYPNHRKFSFVFNSIISHEHPSELQVVDKDLKILLEDLFRGGFLNNTVLILMADHGARFQSMRHTVQGKLEERLPYMSFRFPAWFEKKYPKAMKNMRTNVHRLTTPFDIHATFKDMLDYAGESEVTVMDRGISLFKEIPKERTCRHADVEPHWCACVNWEKADIHKPDVQAAVDELIKTINQITSPHRDMCEVIRSVNISSAVKFEPNKDVLRFKKSGDHDGFKADMSDNTQLSEILYQVTVRTSPGNGLFEATIKYKIKEKTYEANDREISRINKYGKQPHCIMNRYAHLRPYCYCKVQIK